MNNREKTYNDLMKINKSILADNLAAIIDLLNNQIEGEGLYHDGWVKSRRSILDKAPSDAVKFIILKNYEK